MYKKNSPGSIGFEKSGRLKYINRRNEETVVISFMAFPFGMFAWIVPFILIFIGIKAIRHMYHSSHKKFYNYYDIEDQLPDRDSRKLDNNDTADNKVALTSYNRGEWESRIFRLAYKNRGRITLSDIVLETELGLKDAETIIEEMIDGVHVRMEVREDGLVIYEFPEIIARFEGDDDLKDSC